MVFPAGYAMADPSLSPVEMGFTFAGLLGGLTGAGLLFSWRRARREQLHAQSTAGPALPLYRTGTPPWLLDLPTAPPNALVPVSVDDFRTERALRRARTALFALSSGFAIALRVHDVRSHGTGSLPVPLAAGFVLAFVGALSVTPVLRWRTRHLGAAAPRTLGGIVTRNDTGRVGRHFSHAPLLRATNRHDRLLHPLTVDGNTGGRHWWIVQQYAAMHGTRQPLRRTTCLVWLPRVNLPSVLVQGRDGADLRQWFGSGLELESWHFGQRLHIDVDRAYHRQATDVLHARMMEHLLAYLPDGGALLIRGDLVSLVFNRPLHLSEAEPIMTFLLTCADLLPTFLLKDSALSTQPT
jgi:hypothetical protein